MKQIYILSAAVLWGLIGLFTQFLSEKGIDSGSMVFIRAIGAAIFLSLYFLIFNRKVFRIRLRDIPFFIGTGIVSFVFFNYCYFQCIKMCSLSVAAILLYTAPIFVTILSFMLFREKFSAKKGIALIFTLVGCVFVSGILGSHATVKMAGILLGILSGLFYGLYSILGRYVLKRYSSETVTLYTFIFAAAGAGTIGNLNVVLQIPLHIDLSLLCLGLVMVSTTAPFLLYTKGLSSVPSGVASILATLEPVVATLIGIFFFHETFTWLHFLGICFILAADTLLIFPVHAKVTKMSKNSFTL